MAEGQEDSGIIVASFWRTSQILEQIIGGARKHFLADEIVVAELVAEDVVVVDCAAGDL